jgi:glycosyltransferase involved in cell wall biosynthesis
VGALGDRRKGFDALFAAWKALAGDGDWDARLIVVGAGGELEAWRARAAAAGLGDSVRFAGFQPDVRRVLVACDAIVSPARYEAYGLAVQEAACMGLMPIVSRHAGVAERVPAALAPLLIADPEDAGEVAARLRAWQAEREAYRAHAADFAAALHAWTWDDMAGRVVDILERAA